MDQAKYNEMKAMLQKLEDIKNSQESILDKINHVITDLFQHPDKDWCERRRRYQIKQLLVLM